MTMVSDSFCKAVRILVAFNTVRMMMQRKGFGQEDLLLSVDENLKPTGERAVLPSN